MRRGRRSALSPRTSRGNSSALNRKSCHASVSVTLEKRGGRCRTDGPRRVLSCQMWHTIAAIKAAWRRSLRSLCVEPPLRVRPTAPVAGSSSQLAASAESLTGHGSRAQQPTVCLHLSDVPPVRHAQGTLSCLFFSETYRKSYLLDNF